MSSFRRTTSGLQNQHLFHNVDLVIFVEGGNVSYTKAQVNAGNYTEVSHDIIYWSNVFTSFLDNKKLKLKSVGSKTTIKEILKDIIENEIETALVAMDNEFDEIVKGRVNHKNAFYTYGYSWENDIWNQYVVRDILQELSGTEVDIQDIETNIECFVGQIRYAVFCDGYLFSKGQSFFQRSGGSLSFVNCEPADLPHIKIKDLKARINAKGLNKSTVYSFARRKNIETKKHCYGHLFADYCWQLICHYLRNRLSLPPVRKELANRMAIRKFFQNYYDGSEVQEHYQFQFAR